MYRIKGGSFEFRKKTPFYAHLCEPYDDNDNIIITMHARILLYYAVEKSQLVLLAIFFMAEKVIGATKVEKRIE